MRVCIKLVESQIRGRLINEPTRHEQVKRTCEGLVEEADMGFCAILSAGMVDVVAPFHHQNILLVLLLQITVQEIGQVRTVLLLQG